jgi:hypothetical protein
VLASLAAKQQIQHTSNIHLCWTESSAERWQRSSFKAFWTESDSWGPENFGGPTHLQAQASRRHNGGQADANQLPQHDRLGPSSAHTTTKHSAQHRDWGHQVAEASTKEADCQDGVEEGCEAIHTREGVGNLTNPSLRAAATIRNGQQQQLSQWRWLLLPVC